MTKRNTLNVELSNSQANTLKKGTKNSVEVTLNLSLNVTATSNDDNSFTHKILLIDRQVSKLCKAVSDSLPPNIKLSKTQLSKREQSGDF